MAILILLRASLVAQMVKNLPAVQETRVGSLGLEDPREEGMGKALKMPSGFNNQELVVI